MSDYQSVIVKAVDKMHVTIEVVEHVASGALSSIFDEGEKRANNDGKDKADKADWLKIGAMLLLDEKARLSEITSSEDHPSPEEFVSEVTKLDANRIGTGDGGGDYAIYRALLKLELVRPEDVKLFAVGDTWGAVADLGGDFDDLF